LRDSRLPSIDPPLLLKQRAPETMKRVVGRAPARGVSGVPICRGGLEVLEMREAPPA